MLVEAREFKCKNYSVKRIYKSKSKRNKSDYGRARKRPTLCYNS